MNDRDLLLSGAQQLGISLTPQQVESFFTYLAELKKWNRKINLTSITDDRDALIKHFLDSLSYAKGFDASQEMALLDMGSGAGFPALPLKIAFPRLTVALVESVKKKGSFLRHIIRTLSLSKAEVFDVRTSELPETHHQKYDVVTARAFAEMSSAIQSGVPFVKTNGLIVLSRGPEEALEDGKTEGSGVMLEKRVELALPFSDYGRAIWIFRKVR